MSESVRVQLRSEALPDDAEVRELTGNERLGALYTFEVTVLTRTILDVESLMASAMAISFVRGDDEIRRVHAMVVTCRDLLLHASEERAYRLSLAPRLWVTKMVETLDIFMGMSVPEIVAKKLELNGMEVELDLETRLVRNYPPREFVVQYRETDLAFISRLTEHLGITLGYEQTDKRDVVVLSDDNSAFLPIDGDTVQFAPRGERIGVYEIEQVVNIVPRLFVQRDYNYRNPAIDLTGHSELGEGSGGGIVEYGGHAKTAEEATLLADVRAQEQRAKRVVFEGEGSDARIAAGRKMTITHHPSGEMPLVITEATHRVVQPTRVHGTEGVEAYHVRFRGIAETVTYRPPREAPKPRIHGVVTGMVDAESTSDYAQLDESGRYRVRFMFDTSTTPDGKASRAVRMMQPHTGSGYGMHFPLRPGTEVLITFVDGDPDRPIIAGTVPNPQTASVVDQHNGRRNVIRTGSGNELNLDDDKGKERIKLTSPYGASSFQLGAPNSPEHGAMLETKGAKSEFATLGNSSAGAFRAAFSPLLDLARSGNIISEAGRATPFEMLPLLTDVFIPTVLEAMSTDAARKRAGILKDEAAQAEAASAAAAASEKHNELCKACLAQAKSEIAAMPAPDPESGAKKQQLLDELDAVQTSRQDMAAAHQELMAAIDDRNGAIPDLRESGQGINYVDAGQSGLAEPLLAYSTSRYLAYYADRQEALDRAEYRRLRQGSGNTLPVETEDVWIDARRQAWRDAATPASYAPDQQTADRAEYARQRAASGDTLPEMSEAEWLRIHEAKWEEEQPTTDARQVHQDAVAQLRSTLGKPPANEALAACLSGHCGALPAALDAALAANEAYGKLLLDNMDRLQDLRELDMNLARANRALERNELSVSFISFLRSMYDSKKSLASLDMTWKGARSIATAAQPAAIDAAMPPDPAIKMSMMPHKRDCVHMIGADDHASLWAGNSVNVHGKHTLILGVEPKPDLNPNTPIKEKMAEWWKTVLVGLVPVGLTAGLALGTDSSGGLGALEMSGPALAAVLATYDLPEARELKAAPTEGTVTVLGAAAASLLSLSKVNVAGKNYDHKFTEGSVSEVKGAGAEFARVNVVPAHYDILQEGPDGKATVAIGAHEVKLAAQKDPDKASLTVSGAGAASLLVDTSGLSAAKDAVQVHVGNWELSVRRDGAALGLKDQGQLDIRDAATKLTHAASQHTITIDAAGVKMVASTVDLGVGMLKCGNDFLVKSTAPSLAPFNMQKTVQAADQRSRRNQEQHKNALARMQKLQQKLDEAMKKKGS